MTVPESRRWTDTRRGEEFLLSTLNVRMLPDGHLAVKAYGRPVAGGRGAYVSFPVPDDPELAALVAAVAMAPGTSGARTAVCADHAQRRRRPPTGATSRGSRPWCSAVLLCRGAVLASRTRLGPYRGRMVAGKNLRTPATNRS